VGAEVIIRVDVWEDTKIDGGEHIDRVDMPFGEPFIRFIVDKLNQGLHLNLRGLTNEEEKALQQ
jgi:hypothetical protein